MSLAVTAQGDLIAGTDPGGLVLRISPEGKAFALFDAQLREIHALAPAPMVRSMRWRSATLPRRHGRNLLRHRRRNPPKAGRTPSTSVTITAIDEAGTPDSSRGSADAQSDRSFECAQRSVSNLPDGAADVVWSSPSVTAFAIAPALQPGSVLIGTADKGRIYSVTNDGRDTLLLQSS